MAKRLRSENAKLAKWRDMTSLRRGDESRAEGKFRELRARVIEAGYPLLAWEGIEREVSERRGERGPD